jgi:3',5'-cyclic AMP phosphodiesterase CpdA
MSDLITFLHLSDIHIPDQQGDKWDGVDICRKLDTLIALAEQLGINPSFTVITGDISHTGTERSYHLAKRYIRKIQNLGGPVIPVIGNMDNRTNFSNILCEKPSPQDDSPCYYSHTVEGFHVIAMDSNTPGSPVGSFSEDQLLWLEGELIDHHDEPTVIGFHQPIFFFGEQGMFNKAHATRFRTLVSTGKVLAILNGHMHLPLFTVVDGIYYVQAGSPTFENAHTQKRRLSYDSSSFNQLLYIGGQLFVRIVSFSEGTQLIERTSE